MKLRVLARGQAMVPDIDAQERGLRRFVGRVLDPSKGEKFTDAEGIARQQAVFVDLNDPVEIPSYPEYIRALRDGDLWAADAETARICAVHFDPDFGAPKAEKASK